MPENPTAIPKGSLVLVTAANGHTGSHVVIEVLKQGYKVRGTVRNLSSAQWLLDDEFVAPFSKRGDLELVVADNGEPGSFDGAVKGVSAIIHIALLGDLIADPNVAIPGAVESALNLARSAAKEPSVKRFVFTSSFLAATMPTPGVTDTITNLDTWNDIATQAAWAPPPYGPDRVIPVYMAGKVAGEKALWKFVEDEKLPWVVNSVSPCTILGDIRSEQHLRSFPTQVLEQIYLGSSAFAQSLPAST
jgi:nucleoside-diphosphate-sugar epimerase